MRARAILLGLGVAMLSGCISLIETFTEDHPDKVYVGTQKSVNVLTFDACQNSSAMCQSMQTGFWPFVLIDLPFTMVMDTILLPYTIPATLMK